MVLEKIHLKFFAREVSFCLGGRNVSAHLMSCIQRMKFQDSKSKTYYFLNINGVTYPQIHSHVFLFNLI